VRSAAGPVCNRHGGGRWQAVASTASGARRGVRGWSRRGSRTRAKPHTGRRRGGAGSLCDARPRRPDRWRRAPPWAPYGCRRGWARNGDPEQLRALSDASSALAAGELLQREDAYAPNIAVERYLERCRLKTAALFEAACRLGALIAIEGSTSLAAALGEFAERIGL